MRISMALVVTFCLATPFPLLAADRSAGVATPQLAEQPQRTSGGEAPLLAAADREAARLVRSLSRSPHVETPAEGRAWISRHPALFGALVGAGGGAVASMVMENELFCSGGDEDCLIHGSGRGMVGAGIGAGVGALVGWIASIGSK